MIRTAIVEDDDKIRNNLIDLLEKSGNFRCVAAYSNAEDALADIPEKLPDIVLMDINLPEMDGIECTEKLKAVLPELLIVMLTVYEDANKIFNSLQAGAVGPFAYGSGSKIFKPLDPVFIVKGGLLKCAHGKIKLTTNKEIII